MCNYRYKNGQLVDGELEKNDDDEEENFFGEVKTIR